MWFSANFRLAASVGTFMLVILIGRRRPGGLDAERDRRAQHDEAGERNARIARAFARGAAFRFAAPRRRLTLASPAICRGLGS